MPDHSVAQTTAATVECRSEWLWRGLRSLGLTAGDRVVVLCCDDHDLDRMVGLRAVEKAGLVAVALPAALPVRSTRDRLRSLRPALVLACEEGTALWRQTGVPCRVVGDEPGVLWWKMLEVRHEDRVPMVTECS